ncbi:unnamed protein product [Cunninghamella echinulata]
MNVVKEIQRINKTEQSGAEWSESGSWHNQYKDTSWIFAANLDFGLTEGDIICIFSQYGEILNIEMARDKTTGKSMGFAFLQYEDQRSTILAVDNLNGSKVLARTIRVDHSYGPKPKKKKKDDDDEEEEEEDYSQPKYNAAPPMLEVSDKEDEDKNLGTNDLDDEDPMAAYFRNKKLKKSKKKSKKKKKDRDDDDDENEDEKDDNRMKEGKRKYGDDNDSENEDDQQQRKNQRYEDIAPSTSRDYKLKYDDKGREDEYNDRKYKSRHSSSSSSSRDHHHRDRRYKSRYSDDEDRDRYKRNYKSRYSDEEDDYYRKRR